jgi:predicted nucleotidyltransferase component of viral defense system
VDVSTDEILVSPQNLCQVILEYSDQRQAGGFIQAYTLEEVSAEKIRSLLQRTEPRDLYDLWRILQEPPPDFGDVSLQEIVIEKCIRKQLRFEGFKVLFSQERLERFRRAWKIRLVNQVTNLPDLEPVVRETRRELRKIESIA